jgi:hypothetical protein
MKASFSLEVHHLAIIIAATAIPAVSAITSSIVVALLFGAVLAALGPGLHGVDLSGLIHGG